MAELPPALVFGDDTGACLGAIRSLGRIGVPVHTAGWRDDLPAYGSRYCVGSHRIPVYEADGARWLDAVRELVARYRLALLVPTSDSSTAQLAAHAGELAPARIAAPSPEAMSAFSDKWTSRAMAERLGIPVAPGCLVSNDSNPLQIADRLGLPVVIKARRSYELGDRTQKSSVMLAKTPEVLRLGLANCREHIAESWIAGFCRGVSVLAVEGEVRQAFQHRRLRQKHATGPSAARISEPLDPRLLDAASAMIGETGYSGIAMFEFRCREDSDAFALLEINPRPWGSMQLAMDSGADYVAQQYRWLVLGTRPVEKPAYRAGLVKYSLWGEFEALSDAIVQARRGAEWTNAARRAVGFAARLWSGKGFDSFAEDDPAPFKAERAQLWQRARHRFLPRIGAPYHPKAVIGR